MKINIVVATHKRYRMPNDDMYVPLQVGAESKEDIGYLKDNTGDNISNKNPYFCELTGLYWAWKNIDADYIGIVHYRRHLCLKKKSKDKFDNILSYDEAIKILEKSDVILPKKRNYYIETLYSHYLHTTYIEPLDETRKIIEEIYPDYIEEFDNLKKRRSAHMFNMFVMKKNIFANYCEWLFNILFNLEKKVDANKYDNFHSRFYGRVSELLLDVYLRKNNIQFQEVKFIYMEKVKKVRKIMSFLKAKFKGEKYEKSF